MACELLDTTRTMILCGASSKSEHLSTSPHQSGLFDKTKNVIRFIPATETFNFSARDVSVFFAAVKDAGRYDEFERTLHSFSNDDKGIPRLSGWISLTMLKNIISLVQEDDIAISAVMRRLNGLLTKWPKEIDILCYEGHYFTPKPIMDEKSMSPEMYNRYLLAKALRLEGNSPRWVASTLNIDKGQVRLWDKLDPPPGSEGLMTSLLNKHLIKQHRSINQMN